MTQFPPSSSDPNNQPGWGSPDGGSSPPPPPPMPPGDTNMPGFGQQLPNYGQQPPPYGQPVQPAYGQPPVPNQGWNIPPSPYMAPQPKRRGRTAAIIAICLLVLVGGCVSLVLVSYQRDGKPSIDLANKFMKEVKAKNYEVAKSYLCTDGNAGTIRNLNGTILATAFEAGLVSVLQTSSIDSYDFSGFSTRKVNGDDIYYATGTVTAKGKESDFAVQTKKVNGDFCVVEYGTPV